MRKGALNSFVDPTETGTAVANIEPRATGEYDAWDPEAVDSDEEELMKKVPHTKDGEEYVIPLVKKVKVKVGFRSGVVNSSQVFLNRVLNSFEPSDPRLRHPYCPRVRSRRLPSNYPTPGCRITPLWKPIRTYFAQLTK